MRCQVDAALRRGVGMAMGFFEMSDMAGNDVGWRLRQGFNLVGEATIMPRSGTLTIAYV